MSKEVYYRQCRLQKYNSNSYLEQTSFIPEPYCVEGKILKLRNNEGVWEDGWKIVTVGSNKVLETPDIHKEIRNHRKSTGDS